MHNETLPSRRERQIAARLDQILETAARLFAEKGFHRTTTKEIAEAADVSEGTLYNYFENKNDLLFGILARLADLQAFEAELNKPTPHNARQAFIEMFQASRGFADKHFAMQQAILSEILADANLRERYYQQLVQPSLAALEKDLQTHIQQDRLRPVDASLGARFLISLWTGFFILQVLGDPAIQAEWDALTELSASIIFDGLAPITL
jgi:AcrR family transcriptional regulator